MSLYVLQHKSYASFFIDFQLYLRDTERIRGGGVPVSCFTETRWSMTSNEHTSADG